jgi:hypothetical protein
MTTTPVNSAYTIAFYSQLSGLTVSAKVLRIETGTEWNVSLTESAPLSTEVTRVYLGSFTPTAPGWFIIHYTAVSGVTLIKADILRIEAVVESITTTNPPVTTTPLPDGTQLAAPAVLGDQAGTLTFSVRS